jgi:hypothetical protein
MEPRAASIRVNLLRAAEAGKGGADQGRSDTPEDQASARRPRTKATSRTGAQADDGSQHSRLEAPAEPIVMALYGAASSLVKMEPAAAMGAHPHLQPQDWVATVGADRQKEREEREARRRVLRDARKPLYELPVDHMFEIPGR